MHVCVRAALWSSGFRACVAVVGFASGCASNGGAPTETQESSSEEGTSAGDGTMGSDATGSIGSTGGTGSSSGSSATSTTASTDPSDVDTQGSTEDTGDTEGSSACDRSLTVANRALVGTAIDELFIEKDLEAIDRYWAEPYLQHNPLAASGVAAFRNLMSSFVPSPTFSYERVRTLADCDLVVVQGEYSGQGVIFDMFRVGDGRIIEHWDSDSGL